MGPRPTGNTRWFANQPLANQASTAPMGALAIHARTLRPSAPFRGQPAWFGQAPDHWPQKGARGTSVFSAIGVAPIGASRIEIAEYSTETLRAPGNLRPPATPVCRGVPKNGKRRKSGEPGNREERKTCRAAIAVRSNPGLARRAQSQGNRNRSESPAGGIFFIMPARRSSRRCSSAHSSALYSAHRSANDGPSGFRGNTPRAARTAACCCAFVGLGLQLSSFMTVAQ